MKQKKRGSKASFNKPTCSKVNLDTDSTKRNKSY